MPSYGISAIVFGSGADPVGVRRGSVGSRREATQGVL
jgi:hypothetical protein